MAPNENNWENEIQLNRSEKFKTAYICGAHFTLRISKTDVFGRGVPELILTSSSLLLAGQKTVCQNLVQNVVLTKNYKFESSIPEPAVEIFNSADEFGEKF